MKVSGSEIFGFKISLYISLNFLECQKLFFFFTMFNILENKTEKIKYLNKFTLR